MSSTASAGSVAAAGTRTAKKDGTLAPNSARPPLTPAPKKLVRRRKAAQETQDADSLAVKPTTETLEAEGGRRRSSSFDVSKKVPRTQSLLTLVEATRAPLSTEDVDAEAEHAPDGDEDGACTGKAKGEGGREARGMERRRGEGREAGKGERDGRGVGADVRPDRLLARLLEHHAARPPALHSPANGLVIGLWRTQQSPGMRR